MIRKKVLQHKNIDNSGQIDNIWNKTIREKSFTQICTYELILLILGEIYLTITLIGFNNSSLLMQLSDKIEKNDSIYRQVVEENCTFIAGESTGRQRNKNAKAEKENFTTAKRSGTARKFRRAKCQVFRGKPRN